MVFIGGEQDAFLITAAIVTGILIICVLFLHFLRVRIYKYIKKKTSVSTMKLIKLETPIIIIMIILGMQIVLGTILKDSVEVTPAISNLISTIIIIIVTYILIIISGIMLEKWGAHIHKARRDDTHEEIIPLMRSIISIILGLMAFIFILQMWDVAVGTLLASLGIAGVILGFAFKDTLTNIFGGLALMADDSFRKGDLIELPDGEIGYIDEITLRSTKIRNFDSEEVLVPNGALANMKIKNYARPNKILRIAINISVAYGSDPDKVEKVVLEEIKKHDSILKYPKPSILFLKMADYSLDFRAYGHIKDYHKLYKIRSDLTKKIYNALRKNKIAIPFPTRTIYTKKI